MTHEAAPNCLLSFRTGARAAVVAFLAFVLIASANAADGSDAQRRVASNAANASPAPAQQANATAGLEPCAGVDLVQALKLTDPASFDRFEDSARLVANGQGLLWRVEGQGKVSYLFGTMHSSEAAAKTFDDLVIRALNRARTVAIELPGASTRRVAGELRRLVETRSFRPDGDSLASLAPDVRTQVENRISQAGIPPQVAEQLQPWYLALSLSRSTCATNAGVDTETADARIERLAVDRGANLVALEMPIEQVEALASIPDDVAIRMLRDTTAKRLRPEDVESTIAGLYSTRRIGYLLAMRGPTWAGIFDADGYADFLTAFITRRNATMLQRALPVLRQGDAFLAVGALHLPGDNGLVELIRKSGFTVTRIW